MEWCTPLVKVSDVRMDIQKAIPLPDCPVKKEHAIASRIWMEKKINEYLDRLKSHYEQSPINEPQY